MAILREWHARGSFGYLSMRAPPPPLYTPNILSSYCVSQMRADRLKGDEHIMQTYEEKCAEHDKCLEDYKAADAKLAAVTKRMDEMKVRTVLA